MPKIHLYSFETEWGKVFTAATETGLAVLTLPGDDERSFDRSVERLFPNHEMTGPNKFNRRAEKQVKEYYLGKRRTFDIPLDIQAPPFYKKVLTKVTEIPFGQTASYGQIARAVGNPRAARAVGTANANNHLPLVVPCHRIVAGNGIGGFGGNLALKRKMLNFEGVHTYD